MMGRSTTTATRRLNAGDEPPRLYKRLDSTTDADRINDFDGPILLDGDVVRVEDDWICHGWMGRMGLIYKQPLDEPALLLKEVEHV